MMKFINREKELGFLEKKYLSPESEFLVIYGRRRIGKTELLSKFLEKKRSLYFLSRGESKEETLRRINFLLVGSFKDIDLVKSPLKNWEEIFEYLAKKAETRLIFVIDEFPFLVERFPEVISILQDKWDHQFRKTRIMLILCGSSISMMEKYAVDYQSPLYGRRTGQWRVLKIPVKHLSSFFPKFSLEERFLVYSVIDTIPGYLIKFSPTSSAWENIKDKILSKGEFLYEEVEILLREELRDPSNYQSILAAVAGGLTSFQEIYQRTQLDKSLLSKYLYILERLNIVEKELPVTESFKSKLKAKGALYRIKDNFFDFWFKFVYLNKQDLEKGENEKVLKEIQKDISSYLGKKFEDFIIEILPQFKIMDYNKCGRWWHKDKEIDICAVNEQTKEILFGECKWQDKVDVKKVLAELKEKTQYVNWHNQERKEYFAIFAKSFKEKIKEKGLFLFDLKDLEKLLKDKK